MGESDPDGKKEKKSWERNCEVEVHRENGNF